MVNDLQLELRRFKKLLPVAELVLADVNQHELINITADKNQPKGLFFLMIVFDRPEGICEKKKPSTYQ